MKNKQPHKAWSAPAKINLFLHVLNKRPDGYHNLQTAFQFLNYGDDLFFEINNGSVVKRSYDYGFDEDSDLCLRAAKKIKKFARPECGVTIGLEKRLPMGGGLGGGSSDAATVLLALNELWNVGLSTQHLAEIGLELGADVPVFIEGRSAWAEGVGEQLSPINPPESWFVVLIPPVEVSTKQIFSNKRLTEAPQMKKIPPLEKDTECERVIDSTFGINQLQAIVCDDYPEVKQLLEWLYQFGQPRMSGSGGSVFIEVKDEQQGLSILSNRPSNSAGFVAKGENFHPLYKK